MGLEFGVIIEANGKLEKSQRKDPYKAKKE